jgi:hypothetical protein
VILSLTNICPKKTFQLLLRAYLYSNNYFDLLNLFLLITSTWSSYWNLIWPSLSILSLTILQCLFDNKSYTNKMEVSPHFLKSFGTSKESTPYWFWIKGMRVIFYRSFCHYLSFGIENSNDWLIVGNKSVSTLFLIFYCKFSFNHINMEFILKSDLTKPFNSVINNSSMFCQTNGKQL